MKSCVPFSSSPNSRRRWARPNCIRSELRNNDIVRIYDVLLGYSDCLMATDEILRAILIQPEFQKEMGTAELHHLIGKYCAEWERKAGLKDVSVLAAAYRAGVPCY